MEDNIIIKHSKIGETPLSWFEDSIKTIHGDDTHFTKETVQALIDKIKEQHEMIKTISLHLNSQIIDNQTHEKEIKRLREYIGQVAERDIVPDDLNHSKLKTVRK